ncbi:4Fe-4S dicluster domain-containing protein [Anaeromicropila populeti]|uniref:Electron transport complex protein RnfC n=1 Tax=Anaeromicropila populeti TaxID=37658 RepID=A0A1I6IZN0_9FIRM|nr:4Fe-4S dicluster domain-containing protein [Anaeromicropila populeti]SFR72139.1 electron transport complex protein RnfC [Anaeromicropila populeti]
MDSPIITKKYVKGNRIIKNIQKQSKKSYSRIKVKFPKAFIGKVVQESGFVDLSEEKHKDGQNINTKEESLLDRIKQSGLTGMSGNGFSVYKKLEEVIKSTASEKVLIINGAECDPGLIHDEWLLRNRMDEIIEGSKIVSSLIKARKVYLAVKIENIGRVSGMEVKVLPNKYPVGAEKVVIKHVLNVELSRGEIPVHKGILVMNVQTVIAIGQIQKGTYLNNTRYITAADCTNGIAKAVRVDYGMSVEEVAAKVLGEKKEKKIYLGGGVMDAHLLKNGETITETINFVGYGSGITYNNEAKCRKCGACSRNCPMGIKVIKIVRHYDKKLKLDKEAFSPDLCLKCGACSFVCPAGKNVMWIMNKMNE